MSSSELRRRSDDRGFSLVEIVVAMGLLSMVLVASLPMFLSMVRASVTTRMETQSKNLTQERMEQLQDLRYHVDQQNGPFLDLLDIYYTHATVGGGETSVTVGADTLTGEYIATGGGTNGEPVAPYYRVETEPLDGAPQFTQVVTTQFLTADGGEALPRERFENVYDSQAADGRDAPPSLMLGVTVITRWTEGDRAKSYRTYTQMTDSRPEQPVIQSQARAVAVEISSTAADGTTLSLQGGVSSNDGEQASGSSVSGYVAGAVATRTGGIPVTGKGGRFSFPQDTAVTPFGNPSPGPSGGCASSWYAFGQSSVTDVTGSIADGVPKAPSSGTASSGQLDGSGDAGCGVLRFHNDVTGGNQSLALPPTAFSTPYVKVDAGAGNPVAVRGSTYVRSSALTTSPLETLAGASAAMDRPVILFPSVNGGAGLVTVQLTDEADVSCASTGGTGSVSGSYQVLLRWYGSQGVDGVPKWWSTTYTYNSAAGEEVATTGDVWDPEAYDYNGVPLSEYVTAGDPATLAESGEAGVRGFPTGVLSLTTAPTLEQESLTAGEGHSRIQVQLGRLTCVADDRR